MNSGQDIYLLLVLLVTEVVYRICLHVLVCLLLWPNI